MLTFYPQDCALVYEIQHQLLFGMSLCFVQKNEEGAHQARNFKSFVRCINPGRIRIHLAIHSDGDGNPRLGGVAIVYLCFPRLTTWSRTWWWLHFLVWCGSTNHLRHYLPSTWIPYKHVQQKIRYKRHGEYCKTKRLNILLNLVLLSWISKVEYARNMNEKR